MRLLPFELVMLCLRGWVTQVWLYLMVGHVISLGAVSDVVEKLGGVVSDLFNES